MAQPGGVSPPKVPIEMLKLAYGSVLGGGLVAFLLTGMVAAQCIVYFKLYHEDSLFKKLMVLTVWMNDLVHSALIAHSLFFYFILSIGGASNISIVPPSLPLSFFVTGVQTFITHSFFVHKIHRSSGSNWLVSSPIIVLMVARLGILSFATTELLIGKSFMRFGLSKFGWTFTVGLALSASTDAVIAGCSFYYLRRLRKRIATSTMVVVVDALTKYTLELGFLTCVATSAALITWKVIPSVSLGLHFLLAKLYINSLLASFNTRKELRDMREELEDGTLPSPIFSPEDFASMRPRHPAAIVNPLDVHLSSRRRPIEITVSKKVQHTQSSFGDLSDKMYPRPAPLVQSTVDWRLGSYQSTTSLGSDVGSSNPNRNS